MAFRGNSETCVDDDLRDRAFQRLIRRPGLISFPPEFPVCIVDGSEQLTEARCFVHRVGAYEERAGNGFASSARELHNLTLRASFSGGVGRALRSSSAEPALIGGE